MKEVVRKNVCYLSFDGMTDPLGQSQVIPYLIKLSEKGFKFHIVSVEKEDMMNQKGEMIRNLLKQHSIEWTTIPYSNKIPFVSTMFTLKKVYKIAIGVFSKNKFDLIHFRGYTLGNTVRKLKRKTKIPVIFDMRSFLPDERVLGGMWNLKNPLHYCIYKYFKFLEGRFYTEFERTISQTYLGANVIKGWGYDEKIAKVEVVPCCADLKLFDFDADSQSILSIKADLDINAEDFVLGYVGSIGTWYCLDDMMRFFKVILEEKPSAKFVFLSPVDPSVVFNSATKEGVDPGNIRVKFIERKNMPSYIKVFNWSVFFIKPGVGKAASCPVKHGELMGMGVPVVANGKVGDIDLIVGKEGSGLIVENFDNDVYKEVLSQMDTFNLSNSEIRRIGQKYYDLDMGVSSYYRIYNDLVQ